MSAFRRKGFKKDQDENLTRGGRRVKTHFRLLFTSNLKQNKTIYLLTRTKKLSKVIKHMSGGDTPLRERFSNMSLSMIC